MLLVPFLHHPIFGFYSPIIYLGYSGCLIYFQAATLEKEAHPALDKLTSKISTLNLEHVRQIKSQLVALSGRVQKVCFLLYDLTNQI